MKLSALISYRERLEQAVSVDLSVHVSRLADPMLSVIEQHQWTATDRIQRIENSFDRIQDSIHAFNQEITQIKADLQAEIQAQEPIYFAASYRLYDREMIYDSNEYILNRTVIPDQPTLDFIQKRIQVHCNWKYPGMIIRPARSHLINDMVAADPLYVIDQNHELLEISKRRFNEMYQARLRWYVINESHQSPMLSDLPEGQFGFCLVHNFFHFKPFEIMKGYLQELYTKLRPGGSVAFTFNDCDLSKAVEMAERNFMCYTPGRLVKTLCESIGYKISFSKQLNHSTTWIEITKPGELTSLRGGQALAEIIPKNHSNH